MTKEPLGRHPIDQQFREAEHRPLSAVWVIEKADSGAWLGTRDRHSEAGMMFGARVPVFWSTLRDAREAWLRYSVDNGYLRRGITLAGAGRRYKPGSDYPLWPSVRFLRVEMRGTDFAIATPEELGVDRA